MKQLLADCRAALFATLACALLCCAVYPGLVFVMAHALFPDKASGSLITDSEGRIRGSRLLAQPFHGDRYFHPRPSAAGSGYDAASSGGSNLGPTSRLLRDQIRERIGAYRQENGLKETDPVPADAVTASGSGLDPHISPENAKCQTARVANARGVPAAAVAALVEQVLERPQLGILGDPRVNTLRLNMALDDVNNPR